MTLGFKFQLFPREKGFKSCSNLKCIQDRTSHRGRRHVKYYKSVQCTEVVIEGLIEMWMRTVHGKFGVEKRWSPHYFRRLLEAVIKSDYTSVRPSVRMQQRDIL